MSDFEPPSFSLGLDFDQDSHLPPPSFSLGLEFDMDSQLPPPSFSLGLDFDTDSQLPPPSPLQPPPPPPPESSESPDPDLLSSVVDDSEDEFELPPPPPDSNHSDSTPAFKRLRRGLKSPVSGLVDSLDDDIEEFSEEEEDKIKDVYGNRCHSLASSSKIPLHGHGVLTSQPSSRFPVRKTGYVPQSISSEDIGSNCKKVLTGQKSMSPVRRFQLIDSDSDDSFLDDKVRKEAKKGESNLDSNATTQKGKIEQEPTANISGREDLWEGFFSEKSFHIPTPAFDEVCKEYFSSVNNKNPILNKSGGCSQTSNFRNKRVQQFNENPQPPAHSYFFHDDPRIQKLVRERLPNFSPIGVESTQGYQNQDVSAFDYTSQFGHGENSKAANRHPVEKNSKKRRKNTRKGKGVATQEPENWINPKRSAGTVQAGEKSAGHWFTNAEGRKVYIAKNGQEMTGRQAYVNYSKESGSGYKRSKKKSTNKKKVAARKK